MTKIIIKIEDNTPVEVAFACAKRALKHYEAALPDWPVGRWEPVVFDYEWGASVGIAQVNVVKNAASVTLRVSSQ